MSGIQVIVEPKKSEIRENPENGVWGVWVIYRRKTQRFVVLFAFVGPIIGLLLFIFVSNGLLMLRHHPNIPILGVP